MHSDFEGIDTHGKPHLIKVAFLLNELEVLHAKKEETYKGSWAKRGFVGAYHNVARPWDRISNAFTDGLSYPASNIAQGYLFDALIDVALYCLKIAATLVDIECSLYTEFRTCKRMA